jgi:PPOX class probable FMN-dependent enzyme
MRDEICSLDELRQVLPEGLGSSDAKVLPRLDEHCRRFIEASPFVVIASRSSDGHMDVSPKGDPPGFIRIIDDSTIAIPERPGNRRCDTFTNVLEVDEVAIIFLVPGLDMTLRVMGHARLTKDPVLLAEMAVKNRDAQLALVVDIRETFVHCGKAPKRARLWTAEHHVDPADFPSMGEIMHDHMLATLGELPFSKDDVVAFAEDDYHNNVY